MSHGLERKEFYREFRESRHSERTDMYPVDEWEMPVSEGEIPLGSHDEAVVIERDREDVDPDHIEDDRSTPC